jgi:hypothetical protein
MDITIEGSPIAFLALLIDSPLLPRLVSVRNVAFPPPPSRGQNAGVLSPYILLQVDEAGAWNFQNFGEGSKLSMSDWQIMKVSFSGTEAIDDEIQKFIDTGIIKMSPFEIKRGATPVTTTSIIAKNIQAKEDAANAKMAAANAKMAAAAAAAKAAAKKANNSRSRAQPTNVPALIKVETVNSCDCTGESPAESKSLTVENNGVFTIKTREPTNRPGVYVYKKYSDKNKSELESYVMKHLESLIKNFEIQRAATAHNEKVI